MGRLLRGGFMRALAIVACLISFHYGSAEARVMRATVPTPRLVFVGTEHYETGGRQWVRYRFHVSNKAQYAADFFAVSPDLPPCGLNPNASRTWIDFYDSKGHRLYGFCALTAPQDLDSIWFAIEEGQSPPTSVYIEMNDRRAAKIYRSNLARTTLRTRPKPKPVKH
jgi:hypothetical protein